MCREPASSAALPFLRLGPVSNAGRPQALSNLPSATEVGVADRPRIGVVHWLES